MSTEWFQAKPERDGVMISTPGDPLAYIWQDTEQVREIIDKLEIALATIKAAKHGPWNDALARYSLG